MSAHATKITKKWCAIDEEVVERFTCMPGVGRKLTRTAERTVLLLLSLSPEDRGYGISCKWSTYSDLNLHCQDAFLHLDQTLTCFTEIIA